MHPLAHGSPFARAFDRAWPPAGRGPPGLPWVPHVLSRDLARDLWVERGELSGLVRLPSRGSEGEEEAFVWTILDLLVGVGLLVPPPESARRRSTSRGFLCAAEQGDEDECLAGTELVDPVEI